MTEKHTRNHLQGRSAAQTFSFSTVRHAVIALPLLFAAATVTPLAISQARQSFPTQSGGFGAPPAQTLQLPAMPDRTPITANGAVVEDVIARINDQIITRSEYARSEQNLLQEAQRGNGTEAELRDLLHNLLRDMIDQQLLLSKGKELGINCDSEVVRQLDEIRKQNHLDSMEALEKAAATQGISYEDFKQGIRNQCVSRQVVQDQVGRRLTPSHAAEEAYYKLHAKEFEVPEQVHLSEILVPTAENASDADVAAAQAKANDLEAKLKGGSSFAELAKASSGGPTASAGGDLGDFKRGALGQVLEDATFSLPTGGFTAPIRTRQGFVILRVDSHQTAGVPPMADVENQLQQAIYVEQLQPALRAYLTKARDEAYVEIAPGFVDTGSPHKTTKPADIAYTAYTPPPVKKKVQVKQRVEQERAAKAQAELAAAREKLAEKQAEKAAASTGGVKNSSKPIKQKRIRKEKIRYGQAPRNALPGGVATAEATSVTSGTVSGQAPGVAMAPTESITSITTGTGVDSETSDPLAPREGNAKKSRFASREVVAEEERAKTKLAKAETKATTRPVAATPVENVDEKTQAAPLGLNGDTVKKQKKPKRQKGEVKERLQDKPAAPKTDAQPVAPTVNPTLNAPATTPTPKTAPSADQTTLPPADTNPPGAVTQGQPVPATPGPPKL
jgi:peptidyl-prolyl cis-trans isomerase SurA